MRVKLIEVLNMVADNTLKDNERIIIEDKLYYFNKKEKLFYATPKDKCQSDYRNIFKANLVKIYIRGVYERIIKNINCNNINSINRNNSYI